jgi:hypothetical protein
VQAVFIADSYPATLKAALLATATHVRSSKKMLPGAFQRTCNARAIEPNDAHATLGDGATFTRQKPLHNDVHRVETPCNKKS